MVKTDISNLGKYSKTKISVKCDICEFEKEISYKLYTSYGYSNGEYLCRMCKLKKNNLEKYGVENVFQLESIKKKSKETNMEKYGVEYISQSEEIKEKIKETNLEKYGEIHHLKNKNIFSKLKETNLKKYGVENISQLQEIKDKKSKKQLEKSKDEKIKIIQTRKNSNINKYNYYNFYPNTRSKFIISNHLDYIKYIGNKNHLFKCKNGHNFIISTDNFYNRIRSGLDLCIKCCPINSLHSSGHENKIYEFLKENYDSEIILHNKKILNGKELDILLPELKIAFEFNGLFYHSELYKEKNYHKNKSEMCLKKDIQLIHIWEDDWINKQNIIKSMILNKINKTTNKIFARKCKIKKIINLNIIKIFLNNNHIQGYVNSSIKIGLYHNDELVSLMCFKSNKNNEYELVRFCNKLNTNVIGGASKLLNHFKNSYDYKKIISFSNNDYSNGGLYKKLNFTIDKKLNPDYYYIVNGIKKHKFGFRKKYLSTIFENSSDKTELEICRENNLLRIYDSGKIRWILKN